MEYILSFSLETKRLRMKPVSLSELDDLYELRSDPDVMRYIQDGRVWTRAEVEKWINYGLGYFDKYGLDFFSVFEKESENFVGQAGLFHLGFDVNQSTIELAYRLHKKYWGLGYATELARCLIQYGFEQLALPEIVCMHHPDNIASKRVIEKAGLHYVGTIQHQGSELPYYEIHNKST